LTDGRRYVLGVGASSAATVEEVADLVRATLADAAVDGGAIQAVATIEERVDHPAVRALDWPAIGYPPDVLASVPVPNPSDRVAAVAGTPSVAEAAARRGDRRPTGGDEAHDCPCHSGPRCCRTPGDPPVNEPATPFAVARDALVAPDEAARTEAEALHLRLTKPPGSLGRLEALGAQLAAISGQVPPPLPVPAAVAVFAGDHGVHAEGVTPWPQEVTGQMVANFLAGGAAINVLARQQGATVVVVDVGVATPVDETDGLLSRRIRSGTANLATGPAMTAEEAARALDVGVEVARQLVADGHRSLVTGDMGIANTTPSAALIAALTGRPASEVTGRGTGIADDILDLKTRIVAAAAERVTGRPPMEVLAEVGGLEIAALAGFIVGAAAERVPVVIDGVIACAALLVAARLAPLCLGYAIPGHRSVEPGATAVLDELELVPVVDLDLRLGEGTGGCLALPIVEASARILSEMATFDGAGVTQKDG
jgi:nicotinate-nucleotide--dimethylbenzimidazole phosphoribosyltransferase